jgi:hypothetical protein
MPPGGSHPGAQLSFSDIDGHRFQAFITDQPDPNITTVELRHRQHARIEQRIRGAKATGLGNLPFDRLRRNAVWLELVLLALDLVAWAQVLLLDDELAVAQPRRCATGCGIRPPRSADTPPPGRPVAAPLAMVAGVGPGVRPAPRFAAALLTATGAAAGSPGHPGWRACPWAVRLAPEAGANDP